MRAPNGEAPKTVLGYEYRVSYQLEGDAFHIGSGREPIVYLSDGLFRKMKDGNAPEEVVDAMLDKLQSRREVEAEDAEDRLNDFVREREERPFVRVGYQWR